MNYKSYTIISLYEFFNISKPRVIQKKLYDICTYNKLKGIIIISTEGINLNLSGKNDDINIFISNLSVLLPNTKNELNFSFANKHVYDRLKIKIKNEILTSHKLSPNPNIQSGKYIKPQDWNKVISDKNTILIDTRNYYEVSLGTFPGSLNPKSNNFKNILYWLDTNIIPTAKANPNKLIAMFCTGGIRCEKATAYIKTNGINNVVHLKGGILNYLEVVKKESKWKGECFVFDKRVSVTDSLAAGNYELCHACRLPLSKDELNSIYYVKGISCPKCFKYKTKKQLDRYKERQKQIIIARKKNIHHLVKINNLND